MAQARAPGPESPGFRTLSVLVEQGSDAGRRLNGEALARLERAHAAGFSHDDLAELYNQLKLQIEHACPGWRADRVKCSDGAHAFVGALGPVLVITPERSIYLGHIAGTAAEGLLSYGELTLMPDSTLAFPPPNPSAPGTRRVC